MLFLDELGEFPPYLLDALRQPIEEGWVHVARKGVSVRFPCDVQVVAASPPGVFDQAALNAVRKWRFEPVLKQGRAIEASVVTSIRFEPDDAARR